MYVIYCHKSGPYTVTLFALLVYLGTLPKQFFSSPFDVTRIPSSGMFWLYILNDYGIIFDMSWATSLGMEPFQLAVGSYIFIFPLMINGSLPMVESAYRVNL